MSSGLRPLQLPLLVEWRRKIESEHVDVEDEALYSLSSTRASSSSASLATTASPPGLGHRRFPSSVSSFEPLTPSLVESPPSPSPMAGKRPLFDVQEEPTEVQIHDPFEQDLLAEGVTEAINHGFRHGEYPQVDAAVAAGNAESGAREGHANFGYFGEKGSGDQPRRKWTRLGNVSAVTERLTSRRKASPHTILTSLVDYENAHDYRPSFCRTASSRSSSLSASLRHKPESTREKALPPTPPSLSLYNYNESSESRESIASSLYTDGKTADALGPVIERDRAHATTPLLPLPPLITQFGSSAAAPLSPLESPAVQYSPFTSPLTPPLSARPSYTSFHRNAASGEHPLMLAPDAWSDILGHANFTILPQPYRPDTAGLEVLLQLQKDWDMARVNYTKHLVRTGEHYGETSQTYADTENKWAEIDATWRQNYYEVADAMGDEYEIALADGLLNFEGVVTTVPHMDADGKFPERGDVDIVGPMARERTMSPAMSSHSDSDRGRKSTKFWRNIIGRVAGRKKSP